MIAPIGIFAFVGFVAGAGALAATLYAFRNWPEGEKVGLGDQGPGPPGSTSEEAEADSPASARKIVEEEAQEQVRAVGESPS